MEFDPSKPDKLPGLTPSRDIERGTVPTEYLYPYVADYEVECGFCARHTPHRNGYWVRTGAAQIALCGICCVGNFFPLDDVRAMRAGVARLERRRKHDRAVGPLLVGVPQVRRELAQWIPVEVEVERALSRLEFSTWNPDGGVLLSRAVTEAGTIDRVRIEPFMDRGQQRENVVILGRTHAAAVFTMDDRSFVKADKKLALIEEKTQAETLDDFTQRLVGSVRSAAQGCLANGIVRLEKAERFFRRDNIEELNRWLQTQEFGRVRIQSVDRGTGSFLEVTNEHVGIREQIPVPALAELPTPDKLIAPLRQDMAKEA